MALQPNPTRVQGRLTSGSGTGLIRDRRERAILHSDGGCRAAGARRFFVNCADVRL
jgi:hypothetical protein